MKRFQRVRSAEERVGGCEAPIGFVTLIFHSGWDKFFFCPLRFPTCSHQGVSLGRLAALTGLCNFLYELLLPSRFSLTCFDKCVISDFKNAESSYANIVVNPKTLSHLEEK